MTVAATPTMWMPDAETIDRSNIAAAWRRHSLNDYETLYRWSIEEPAAFWRDAIDTLGLRFLQPPKQTLDVSDGVAHPRWLAGAKFNIAESCFMHDADAPALVWRKVDGSRKVYSCSELRSLCNGVANGLIAQGLKPGDAVAICMPMTDLAVAIYLGAVLAGCVVVSIADSFSPDQINMRIRLGQAKLAFTVAHLQRGDKKLPMYARLLEADAPRTIVINEPDALRDGDIRWDDFLSDNDRFEAVACDPDTAINILFSSGTTGEPKAIPWDHATPIKSAVDGHYHHDLHAGDVVSWPTNLGWMMGPWLVFAALLNRSTIALYEGPPMGRDFGEFVQDERITMLGLVPSMVRRWKETACMEGLDWSAIRAFSSTGECSNPEEMHYLSKLAGIKPIIEYCGGTEVGGGYVTSTVVQPNIASAFSTPGLGSAFVILDENGKETSEGEVFLVPPTMGLSKRLLNRDHNEVYHQGAPAGPNGEVLRRHGDQMLRLDNGYFRAMGRADDTMNLGGIKVSAAEIERLLIEVQGVREAAAIGIPAPGGGPDRLIVFITEEADAKLEIEPLQIEMQQRIKRHLNPLFKIHEVCLRTDLPRTTSNKIIRRQLRKEYLQAHA